MLLAGSSPTRMTASPGRHPCAANCAARLATSARTVFERRVPLVSVALIKTSVRSAQNSKLYNLNAPSSTAGVSHDNVQPQAYAQNFQPAPRRHGRCDTTKCHAPRSAPQRSDVDDGTD